MQRDISIGASEYPSPTAGNGKPDGQTIDEVFYPCKQCGFWCLQSRVTSPGGGNEGDGAVDVRVDSHGAGDPLVSAGACPQCGTYNSFGN